MKAVVGEVTEDPDWAAELKWDGLRAQILTDGRVTVVRSATGRDVTGQFPELADFGRQLGAAAILDGELVVFEGDRPSFSRVLQRLNTTRSTQSSVDANPVTAMIFDLLELDEKPLLDLPYTTRRRILDDLGIDGPAWRVSPSIPGGGGTLLALARERDLEGIVVKRLGSIYRPGSRSSDWRKVKIRLRQEFVVGGWLAGQGSLEDEIGSLVLGVWDGPELTLAGLAGSGLTDRVRARLNEHLVTRPTTPFATVPPLERAPQWVEPRLVVEVEFADWPAGGMLRHPAFVGIRHDKDPTEVVREIQPPGRTGQTPGRDRTADDH